MLVRLVLKIENVVVNSICYDELSFDWTENTSEKDIANFSQFWGDNSSLLTQTMDGLTKIGSSSLIIEPVNISEEINTERELYY